jgi:hypothetical protein
MEVHTLKSLSASLRSWIFDLFERNMRALSVASQRHSLRLFIPRSRDNHPFRRLPVFLLYQISYEASADGYDAKEKRQELFDPESRFVVLGSPPVAYAVFRFDTEETADERDAEVVYWSVLVQLQT